MDTALRIFAGYAKPQITNGLGANLAPIKEQVVPQTLAGLGFETGASATEIWRATYWLLVEAANATMDVKIGAFGAPAGCTGFFGIAGNSSAAPGFGAVGTAAEPLALKTLGESFGVGSRAGIIGVPITAIVFGGGTAGTVQIKACQNTSDAGNLTILKGSAVEAVRLHA